MLSLIGYVSDERYVAVPDALLEFVGTSGASFEARSRASGAVYAHIPNGEYKVVIQKPGFGAKFSRVLLPVEKPHHFFLGPSDRPGGDHVVDLGHALGPADHRRKAGVV